MSFIKEGRSQAAIDGCYVCPMCRHQCTTLKATRQETDSPRSKALSLYGLQRQLLSVENSGIVEQMYRCTGCRMCTAWCASAYEPSVMVEAARADMAQALLAPPRVAELMDRLLETGNPLGLPGKERSETLKGFVPVESGQAEVVWYPGCVASHEARAQVEATAALLQASRARWSLLAHEGCCGAVAWSLGFRREAQEMAATTMKAIAQSGAKTVLTSCPTCFRAIRRDYHEAWGVQRSHDAEVLHVSQFLARLLDEGRLSFRSPVEGKVVYHDPCSLGRQMEVFKAPRRVLEAIPGLELVESRHTGEKGECCGSGAGMRYTNPEIAAIAAQQTLEGKLATGATTVVTACPSCQVALEKARRDLGSQVEVVDLVSLAARAALA